MAWLIVFGIALGCWLLLEMFVNISHDTKEPALIPQSVPYVGHLLGMLREGSRYYTRISTKYSLPIYTLRVPRNKIYIVNSPKLVAAVDRHSKSISFAPYVVEFAKRILVPSTSGLEALKSNLDEESGAWGCRPETLHAMHVSLAPGEGLDCTTQAMLESVSGLLSSVCAITNNENINLFSWVRKLVTRASTDAIYGAGKNPFQDPAVTAGFWDIDKDFALLGLNIFPNFIAPRGYRGREKLFRSFVQYYASNGHTEASRVVQARYEVNRKHDLSIEDISRFDLSLCYGLLVNTVPAVSWVIYYIYSQPSLLEELRVKGSFHVHLLEDRAEGPFYRVNIAEVLAGCPQLTSLLQETLRVQSTNASGRVILKDTVIEDQYLLKKGSILLVPSAELHNDVSVWGPSCRNFDPLRFMQKRDGGKRLGSAYRAYGGGASVCPGRFLAANEIMIIVVMMILKYDLRPVLGGVWPLSKGRPHITTSILTPLDDIRVTVMERKGYENAHWQFIWSEANKSPD